MWQYRSSGCEGFFPLHLAIPGHHLEIVKLLFSHGGSPDSFYNHPEFSDSITLKPLTEKDQPEIIEFLVTHNVMRYKKPPRHSRPALESAIDCERQHMLRILVRGGYVQCLEGQGILLLGLVRSINSGFVEGVVVLLEHGPPLEAGVDGRTVRQVASEAGNESFVQLLLAAGANVNTSPFRRAQGRHYSLQLESVASQL